MNEKAFAYIDLGYMDLMADGDVSMKKVMLEMLIEELPLELEKMNDLSQQGSWEELGSVSHKMKSTLAFVGNDKMTEANKEVERIVKTGGKHSLISDHIATLLQLYPDALSELKAEFDRI